MDRRRGDKREWKKRLEDGQKEGRKEGWEKEAGGRTERGAERGMGKVLEDEQKEGWEGGEL
jgi:hypothetical protein